MCSPCKLQIREMPKAEAHLHAGGAFPLAYLCKIAKSDQIAVLNSFSKKILQGMDYEAAFAVFPLISQIVNTNERLEEGILAICEEAQKDGVTVIEIRTGIRKLDGSEEEYLSACLRGIKRSPIKAGLLLSIRRDSPAELVSKTILLASLFKDKGVIGIDISGISTCGDIRPHMAALQNAKADGLKICAHIGESYNETDQMLILEKLNPDRVGHGVCLSKEAEKIHLREKNSN